MARRRTKREEGSGAQVSDSLLSFGPALPTHDLVRIPTGWYALDQLMLSGGVPLGAIMEILSEEGGGKTLCCMRIVAQAQAMGLRCAWADVECYIKPGVPEWFVKQGVKWNDLLVYGRRRDGYEAAEDTLSKTIRLLESSKDSLVKAFMPDGSEQETWADVIVVDSVAALQPRGLIDMLAKGGAVGDYNQPMEIARLLGRFMSVLGTACVNHNKLLIFCNQVRESMRGGGSWAQVADYDALYGPGGRAKKHHINIRMFLRRTKILREDNRAVGQLVKAIITKNQVGQTLQSTGINTPEDVVIWFDGRRQDREQELFDVCTAFGVIQQAGSYYTFGDHKAQGKEKFVELIRTQSLQPLLSTTLSAAQAAPEKRGGTWAEMSAPTVDVSEAL